MPARRAAHVADISTRRLNAWAQQGLVSPFSERRLSPRRKICLYGFQELTELLIVREMLAKGVSLSHIRSVLAYIKDAHDIDQPLKRCVFAIEQKNSGGSEIFFRTPDGVWAGGREPKQSFMRTMIDLDEIRSVVMRRLNARIGTPGATERKRGRLGATETFSGTRIPVSMVVGYIQQGKTDEEIARAFPSLEGQDIALARSRAAAI